MMRRFTIILLGLVFAQSGLFAQLQWGADAPDWTLDDLDGNTHTLSDYLNQGKTVYLTFSATWCGPCWNYHNSGAMDEMWDIKGPDGTDEAMVFFIEADLNTAESCLYGNCGNTQGDWVSNTDYPIINLTSSNGPNVRNDYSISYFPTVYVVCPSGKVYETGQANYNGLSNYLESCGMEITDFVTSSEICQGDANGSIDMTFTPGSGSSSIEWSNGETTEDISNLEPGTYTVTVTDANNIFVEGEATVTGPDLPIEITDVVFEDMVECFGTATADIEIDVTGGIPGYSVEWEDGSTAYTRSNLAPGTYTVTVTDNNTCQETKEYIVGEPDPLSMSLIPTQENCGQQDGLIICAPTGGTAPYQYDIGFGPQNDNVFGNLEAGTYTVTVTDVNACDDEQTSTVTENPGPQASVPAELELDCGGGTLIIDASASVPGSGTDVEWTTTDGNIVSGGTTLTPEVDAEGTYVLNLNNSSTGCSDQASVFVMAPTIVIEASAASSGDLSCNITTVTLDSDGSSSGTNITYSWQDADGNVIGNNATVEVTNAGDYTLVVTDTVENCSNEAIITVGSDLNEPTVEVDGVVDLNCDQNEVTIEAIIGNAGANPTISWQDADGNEIGNTAELVITQAGNYSVIVTNSENGCTTSESFVIESNGDLPAVEIASPAQISCSVAEVTLDGSASSSGGDFEYNWTTTDGNIVSGADQLVAIVDALGTYVLTITNTANGCVGTNQVEVTGYTTSPEATTELQSDRLVLEVNATILGIADDVLWDFGDGNTSTSLQATHEYAAEGTYNVCLTVSNDCGDQQYCEDVVITDIAAISASADVQNVSCFEGSDGSIDLTIAGGVSPYGVNWNTGATDEDINGLTAGTYTVVITDAEGTEFETSFTVTQPEALISDNLEITNANAGMNDGSISIDVSGGVAPYEFLWSNGATDEDITDLAPGTYSLDVTDANGCIQSFGPFEVEVASNTIQLNSLTSIQLSPNPSNVQAILECSFDRAFDLELFVMNINGQLIYEQRLPMAKDFRVILPTADWNAGMYFVQIRTKEGVQIMPLLKQ